MKHIKPASARNANIALQILLGLSLLYSVYYKVFFIPYSKKIYVIIWISQLILLYLSRPKSIHFLFSLSTVYLLALHIYAHYIVHGAISVSRPLFYTLISLIIGYLLVEDEISELVALLPFIIVSVAVLFIVFSGIRNFDTNNFFNINRNTLPMFVFGFGVLNDIIRYRKGKKYSWLWVSIIILIISYLSRSRTAVVVSALYLILVIVRNEIYLYQRISKEKQRLYLYAMIFFNIILLAGLFYFILAKTRFAADGYSSSGRDKIYGVTLSELTIQKLLTGFRSSQFDFHVSLHNSYLQLITTGGLGGIIVFLLYIILEIVLFIKAPYMFSVSVLLFFYSLPQSFMFFKHGDFALIPLMALAISYLRKRKDKAAG